MLRLALLVDQITRVLRAALVLLVCIGGSIVFVQVVDAKYPVGRWLAW